MRERTALALGARRPLPRLSSPLFGRSRPYLAFLYLFSSSFLFPILLHSVCHVIHSSLIFLVGLPGSDCNRGLIAVLLPGSVAR